MVQLRSIFILYLGKELSKEKKGRGGVRNESRAAKVALMKIKMKATGDSSIPQVCASGINC